MEECEKCKRAAQLIEGMRTGAQITGRLDIDTILFDLQEEIQRGA